jgi:hypothetical protein
MSSYEFFEELSEARIFKNLNLVQGVKADDLAIMLLNMFFALNFIWHEDRNAAVKYAQGMMRDPNLNAFRTTQSDMFNTIALLLHQEKYSDRINTKYDITIPEYRIKRILRDMARGRVDEDDYHQLFLLMMRQIKGVTSDHQRIRRQLHLYDQMSTQDKIRNLRWLMLQFRVGKARYSDLYPLMDKVWKRIT